MTNKRKKIFERVRGIIVDQVGIEFEDIVEDAHLTNDLWFDSLDIIEFIMALEEEFEIEIQDEQFESFSFGTVNTVLDYIEKALA